MYGKIVQYVLLLIRYMLKLCTTLYFTLVHSILHTVLFYIKRKPTCLSKVLGHHMQPEEL